MRQTNEFNNCDVQTSGQAAIPGQTKLVNDLPLKPESCTGGKHRTQSKVPKHSKSGTQKSDTGNILLLRLLMIYSISLGPCNRQIDF